jgi:outer membrane murein-binding lipoprotein Lpp
MASIRRRGVWISRGKLRCWESAWTKNDVLWPRDLLPEKLLAARVLAFGYDAGVVNFWSPAGQNHIGNHAQDLVVELADLRDDSDCVRNSDQAMQTRGRIDMQTT